MPPVMDESKLRRMRLRRLSCCCSSAVA